jgi:hypothetical protein
MSSYRYTKNKKGKEKLSRVINQCVSLDMILAESLYFVILQPFFGNISSVSRLTIPS